MDVTINAANNVPLKSMMSVIAYPEFKLRLIVHVPPVKYHRYWPPKAHTYPLLGA